MFERVKHLFECVFERRVRRLPAVSWLGRGRPRTSTSDGGSGVAAPLDGAAALGCEQAEGVLGDRGGEAGDAADAAAPGGDAEQDPAGADEGDRGVGDLVDGQDPRGGVDELAAEAGGVLALEHRGLHGVGTQRMHRTERGVSASAEAVAETTAALVAA